MSDMSGLKSSYVKNGYAVARNLVARPSLEKVLSDIERCFAQQASHHGIRSTPGTRQDATLDPFSETVIGLFKANQASYLAAAKLAQHAVSLHRLSLCDEIIGVLTDLGIEFPTVCTRQVLHFMADSLRIEGGYHKTPSHQDWRSLQGSLDSIIVWIPFGDVGTDNYPLEVLPGSQRLGLLPSVEDPFGHRVADGIVDESGFVPLEVSMGDAVFFSAFTVHRTGTRGGRNVRVAGSFRFNNAAEPTFVARNYPNPYIYRPDMRLLVEGFPADADIAAAFPVEKPKRA
jgi:ectoine hydroxylase-related dioxygenase (phytanoyl-CoA dioxygenase family)